MDIKKQVQIAGNTADNSASHHTEIELHDQRFQKAKSFNTNKNEKYNKFNEVHVDDHEDHNFFSRDSPLGSQRTFYVIDAESLRAGNAVIDIKDKTANPAALGLLGFGLTTFLLNLHNAGVFPMNSMILAMGLFYGGFAQLLAGIFDWKRGNMFGMIAFLSYGCFWISLCTLIILPKMGYATAADPQSMGWYLFIWGVFSTCMFVGTLKKAPYALCFVFFTVVILFFLLAAHNWTENVKLGKAAGIEGIICGLSAIYTAFGEILNETYGRTMIPLGVRTQPKK